MRHIQFAPGGIIEPGNLGAGRVGAQEAPVGIERAIPLIARERRNATQEYGQKAQQACRECLHELRVCNLIVVEHNPIIGFAFRAADVNERCLTWIPELATHATRELSWAAAKPEMNSLYGRTERTFTHFSLFINRNEIRAPKRATKHEPSPPEDASLIWLGNSAGVGRGDGLRAIFSRR